MTRRDDQARGWVNQNIIRRTGGRPSYAPPPSPYVPGPEDAAPDPRPFAAWTERCEDGDCPAAPRVCMVRMVVHRHLDWPERSAASVQTVCLCRHHASDDNGTLHAREGQGWVVIAVRPVD